MTFGIILGMFIIIDLLQDILFVKTSVLYNHYDNYACTLIIGGFILSSLAFNDMSSTLTRYRFLTLPVSAFEKFICMWLLTTVGWILFFTITYTLYTLTINAFGHLLFDHVTFGAFDPRAEFIKDTIRYYIVLQSIFLAGAAHFRSFVLAKTLVVVVFVTAVFGVATYFTKVDVFLLVHEPGGNFIKMLEEIATFEVWPIIQWIFWWLLAPACWVIAYFGLRDQEA